MPSAVFNANDPYEQLIAQMIRFEAQPQAALRTRKSEQEVQRAVLNDFDSALSALHTVLEDFNDPIANPFAARKASAGDSASFGVTATDTASPGTHSLTVEHLANADTRVSRRLDGEGTSLRSFFDTNGVQTFSIEVASPTDDDPDHRVPVAVTVIPVGSTDAEILAEIRQAITDAMSASVSAGDIQRSDATLASVINETADTTRLSLRSGTTGFDHRLQFADSQDGLLSLLQVDRSASASTAASTTTPATAASATGTTVATPVSIGLLNRGVDVTVDGQAQSVNLALGTYNTADDLAIALGDALGAGVTVDTVDGALRITSASTGASSSLQFTGGSALSDLGFTVMAEPTTGQDEQTVVTSADESGGWMHDVGTSDTDSALNARFLLDGLTLYRGSNSVDDALPGVTLSLRATGEASTFSVGTDGDAVAKEVEGFIKKYNAALEFIVRKSKVDVDTGKREAFAGDSTIRGLRFGMRTDLIGTVAGQPEGLGRLTDLGIEINDDGTLKLADRTVLTNAVQRDPDAVQRLFNADGDGLATKLQARLDRFVGTNGTLDSRKDVLDERIKRLDNQITAWDTRLDRREDVLRRQFAQLQETIALLQGQQNSISSFLYGGF